MKHELLSVSGLALAGLLFTGLTNAALTPVLPSSNGEPDLAESGGILDNLFGLDNLSRIDDDLDKYWNNNGTIQVETLGRWGAAGQLFGYIDTNNSFTSLFTVDKSNRKPSAQFLAGESGSVFRFGMDPSRAGLWSSNPADNSDLLDHMVTWQINAVDSTTGNAGYVIAWEGVLGGGDQDYNDLVLMVIGDISAVPVPAALWLFGSGILGLAAVARRQSR